MFHNFDQTFCFNEVSQSVDQYWKSAPKRAIKLEKANNFLQICMTFEVWNPYCGVWSVLVWCHLYFSTTSHSSSGISPPQRSNISSWQGVHNHQHQHQYKHKHLSGKIVHFGGKLYTLVGRLYNLCAAKRLNLQVFLLIFHMSHNIKA